jgi:hypothetical protein
MGQGRLEYDLSMNLLRDDPELQSVALQPPEQLVVPAKATMNQYSVAAIYGRLGGLMQALARKTGIDPASVLSVWFVESGSIGFTPRRAPIRVEVHELFEAWGRRDRQKFDGHFRFGGHNQQPGLAWENQEFRTEDSGIFSSVHHNQSSEYAALTLAQVTASDELAFSCTSIGGCQILMSYHRMLGYETAEEMYEAFQQTERFHVIGFFDFCSQKLTPRQGDLIQYLKAKDWNNFAKYYNGGGQVAAYAARLKTGYDSSKALLGVPRAA